MGFSIPPKQRPTAVNSELNLLKILFALAVLMVHTHGLEPEDFSHYPFVGGYLAVEFFLFCLDFLRCNRS